MDLISGKVTRVAPNSSLVFVQFESSEKGKKQAFAKAGSAKCSESVKRNAATVGLTDIDEAPPTRNWDEFLKRNGGLITEGMEVTCQKEHLRASGTDGCFIEKFYFEDD